MDKRLRPHLLRLLPKDNAAASMFPVGCGAGFGGVDFVAPSSSLPRRQHPPLVTADCCLPSSRRRSATAKSALALADEHRPTPPPRVAPAYLWRMEDRWWHVVPCAAAADVDVKTPLLASPEHGLRRTRRDLPASAGDAAARSRRKLPPRRRYSLRRGSRDGARSSADDDSGWSSSDQESETTLTPKMKWEQPENTIRRRRRRTTRRHPSLDGPAAGDKLIPGASPAIMESLAVVQLSEDPRRDFLRSMAEMVVEKKILDSRGLEQLLRCLMSLNSPQHHAAIVSAYEDIWAALFPAILPPPAHCSDADN